MRRLFTTSARRPLAALAVATLTMLPAATVVAQSSRRATSPLWGDLAAGPHRVGYTFEKLRDRTRSAAPGDAGYPLVLSYWYPARAGSGRPMTFAGYQAIDAIDASLAGPTREQLAEADRQLKAFYERPFNFPFGAVEADRWSRL